MVLILSEFEAVSDITGVPASIKYSLGGETVFVILDIKKIPLAVNLSPTGNTACLSDIFSDGAK